MKSDKNLAVKSEAKSEQKTAGLVARYFEKVLGVAKVEASFFQTEVASASEASPVWPIKCWLIDFHQSDLPSIREMAVKLKSAIEAEWVKQGRSGQAAVEWMTGEQYKTAGNIGNELGLVIFFGEQPFRDRSHSASSVGVLVPRLDEMNTNPSLKRDAWRKIQSEIAQFCSSTLV